MSLATNPKQQAWLKHRDETAQRQWENDLRAVMSTPEGRRMLNRLIYVECGLKRVTLGNDALNKAELNGIKWVGSWLDEQLMEHCEQHYLTMFDEALQAKREDALYMKSASENAKREGDE